MEEKELLKYIYDQCTELNWNTSLLDTFGELHGLTYELVISMAREYAYDYLGMSSEAFNNILSERDKSKRKLKFTSTVFVVSLLKAKTNEEIIRILSNSERSRGELEKKIRKYIDFDVFLTNEEKEELYKDFKRKVSIYTNYKEEKKEKRRNEVYTTLRIVENYLSSHFLCFDQYVNSLPEDQKRSSRTLRVDVKHLCPELYRSLIEKEIRDEAYIISELQKIAQLVRQGVLMEDGSYRSFDIIDYYSFLSVPMNVVLKKFRSKLSCEDNITFIRTFKTTNSHLVEEETYKPLREHEIENLFLLTDVVPCQIEGNNQGTRVITDSEKEMFLEYLTNNRCPITLETYNAVKKRYLNNQLYQPYQSSILERKY
jgi:hypothetical protein